MFHTAGAEKGGVRSPVMIAAPGKTYTFSAYLKTGSTSSAYLTLGPDASVVSQTVPGSQGWTRVEVSYTNNTSASMDIYAQVLTQSVGTVYVDCVQVEQAETASRYNIVENGDFRYGTDSWTKSEHCDNGETPVSGGKTGAPTLQNTVFKMNGMPTQPLNISQQVKASGQQGDTYVLAGWAKGNAVPLREEKRNFSIRGTFNYTDGTTREFTFDFNPDTEMWQYACGVMVAEQAYSSINVTFLYDYNANDVYFDGMQLYKEQYGSSYTYDDDGNVVSVKDLQNQTTEYEYSDDGSDLLKIIQDNKAKVTYTYDDYHNVKTATTVEGLVYSFTYDQYGNNTSVSIDNGSTKLKSTATYGSNGNYLTAATGATGYTTRYGYNTDTGLLEWVQYPEDTESTRTEYTYDNMYRMVQTTLETDTGLELSASYTYNGNDQLSKITTDTTTYNFTYGNFGLRSSVKVGNTALANYTYNSTDKSLTKLDYGNGDVLQYTYDEQGRVTKQTYEDGDYITFRYDNSGALARVYDSASGTTSTYYYDFTDRLMKFVEQSGSMRHTASYGYDLLNNLTTMTETFNGEKRTTGYTYDDDNRVTSVETAAGTEFYTYDVYGRVSQIVTKKDGVVILTKSYTYQANANHSPTARVNTMTVTGGGYNKTYQYYYDKNDNLISVSDGTNSTSYYYDSANQLVRENNQAGNLTKGWTYDNAGNILYSREYPYATGTVGTPEETNNYTYGDTNWGDKLTAYNGQTITYDAIGNPLSDGTWSYTWEHGREMASMSKNSALTITQQPEDCFCELGGTASFTVSASGTGLSCRWQYSSDGKNWSNSTNGTATNGTLYIGEVTEYLMGLYWRCIVTDATGHTAVSQTAHCRITGGALKITNQPDNVYCAIGGEASLTVAATGTGLSCRWQYSPDGGKTWHNSTNGTATYATLYIGEVTEYLMGMAWRCKVMDSSGNVEYSRAVYLKRNTTLWTNTYNADGIRVSRTNRESTYNYTYLGGQLTHLTVDGHTMYFYYGADGTPMALSFNGVRYYYVTSLQGDIIAIVDQNGTVVTTYLYDAWGNHLHTTGSLSATVGRYNPLRYRGYVYDRETNLYYLQSRYYNPETGRFINGDAVVSTGQGVLGNNMYVYCLNNPVNFVDRGGNNAEALPWWAGTMWWLNFVDGPLPVGEIVYGAGIVILGVGALIVADDVTTPQVSFEEEKERAEPEPPDVTYPGDDPEKAPEGTQWKGKPGSKEGGREGNYHNPETGESWHPDLEHPEPIGPHWDYRDTHGDWWRIGPNGIITYKDAVRIKEELMHGK